MAFFAPPDLFVGDAIGTMLATVLPEADKQEVLRQLRLTRRLKRLHQTHKEGVE